MPGSVVGPQHVLSFKFSHTHTQKSCRVDNLPLLQRWWNRSLDILSHSCPCAGRVVEQGKEVKSGTRTQTLFITQRGLSNVRKPSSFLNNRKWQSEDLGWFTSCPGSFWTSFRGGGEQRSELPDTFHMAFVKLPVVIFALWSKMHNGEKMPGYVLQPGFVLGSGERSREGQRRTWG